MSLSSTGRRMLLNSPILAPSRATRWLISTRSYSKGQACQIKAVIIGPPGSGKGTISERIIRDFKVDHLSSGDLLRKHIKDKSEFGNKIASVVASGGLVGTELMHPLIEHELKQSQNQAGWLLDGYPRTVEQAERLRQNYSPNTVLYLNVPFETIIERIKDRRVHVPSGRVYHLQFNPPKNPDKDDLTGEPLVQRDDDKPEFVLTRLQEYQRSTDPVIKFYEMEGLLQEFQGTESNVIYPLVVKYMQETFFSTK